MGTFSTVSTLFDGVNEYAQIGDVAALQFERTNPFSISVWFKTSTGSAALAGKQAPSTTFRGYLVNLSSAGAVEAFILNDWAGGTGNGIWVTTTTTGFNNGQWHHAVMTYDGSSTAAGVRIYVDGSSRSLTVGLNTLSATILTTANFRLARRDDGTSPLHLNGNLDEVAVYDKALTSDEVIDIFNLFDPPNLSSVGPTGNLVGWWRMGEGATFPTIPDDSVNSNAATLTNMESGDLVSDTPSPTVVEDFGSVASASLEEVGLPGDTLGQEGFAPADLGQLPIDLPNATGGPPIFTFKMRGIADPGPGYVVWTVTGTTPDFTGTFAPGAIVPGSAIVADQWES